VFLTEFTSLYRLVVLQPATRIPLQANRT